MKRLLSIGSILIAITFSAAISADGDNDSNQWITLGTMAGPVPNATHSQPANALLVGSNVYFVDAGDGAVGRLTTAGVSLRKARAVFLSHLHFDHIAGLPAIIALRWQTNAPDMLTIYGPPGTKQTGCCYG